MPKSQINNVTFFVLNSTLIVYFNMVKSTNLQAPAHIMINLQTQTDSPPIIIEISVVPMHVGVNLIIHQVTDDQNQFFQTLQLRVTSLNNGQMGTYYSNQFIYDTTQGLLQITTFTIQPTAEFILQAHFNGLIDYILNKVYIGDVVFDNSNCPSLNQIIKSEVNLVCDLSTVGFETQQYLANLIQHNFIPIRYIVYNSIYQFTSIAIQSQIMIKNVIKCISQPHISINNQVAMIYYSMSPTNQCITNLSTIRITISFLDQIISQKYRLISHFLNKTEISFQLILTRQQYINLKDLQPYDNVTVLTVYPFQGHEIKLFDCINSKKFTHDRLVMNTMKFSKKQFALAYTQEQIQTTSLTIIVNFFFDSNTLANIYLMSPVYFHSAGEIKFSNDDIKQDYNPDTYIIKPTIEHIYNEMINTTNLYVIIEGVLETQIIINFINTDQYLNSKLYLILGLLVLVQILFCSIFFALSRKQY